MPSSIINSDDGVVSGTSGLKSVGGDDGVLVFQSKGTETARINTDKQIVAAAGTNSLPALTTTGDLNTGIYFPAADTIAFTEGGVEAMRIDSSGKVCIATTQNTAQLNIQLVSSSNIDCIGDSLERSQIRFRNNANNANTGFVFVDSTSVQIGAVGASSVMRLETNGSERARITSGGDFLVGKTSVSGTSGGSINFGGTGTGACSSVSATVASGGSLDISVNTGGGAWMGILLVSNALATSANESTRRVFAVTGRGTTAVFTQLAIETADGGYAFSMSCPSNGVMRATNNGVSSGILTMTFFGCVAP